MGNRLRHHASARSPLCVAAAVLVMVVASPLLAAPPTPGLVGYWPFDGSFDDASGNGNHAESLGAELAPDRFGRPDHAVAVSTSQFVLVADAPSLELTGAFTVATWMRVDAIERAFNCLVSKDHSTEFGVCLESGGSGTCPDPGATCRMALEVGDLRRDFTEVSFECGTGEWKHVAVSFDAAADEARLYVDGALVETLFHEGVLTPSTSPLGIGNNGSSGDCYTGLLDDVCLYDRVLGEDEVLALYTDQQVTPSVENPGAMAYVVSASAHAEGLNQTSWLTDLVLHNPGDADATADLFFLATRTDNTLAAPHRITVPASTSVHLADVVSGLFGRDGATGAILVGCDRPLIVSSRTFNDADSGTFGQYIAGVDTTDVWGGDSTLPRLVQLAHSPESDTGFRTNLGAVNLGPSDLTVDLQLRLDGGEMLGTVQLSAPPYGHVQLSNVFADHAPEKVEDAYAQVTSVTAGARYLVYASVVDNRSGDPVYIPGR